MKKAMTGACDRCIQINADLSLQLQFILLSRKQKVMSSPKKNSKVVARLQNGLPFWSQEGQATLSLEEVADQSGCSKRRIRHLIQLGLVDGARKVGARSSYSKLHVRQARAVERLLDEGRFTLTDLAWLNNPDAVLALNLAEELTPQEFLFSLSQSEADNAIDELVVSRSTKSSPFQRRILAAITSAMEAAVLAERRLISEVQDALKAQRK